jgi:hypothetical protein
VCGSLGIKSDGKSVAVVVERGATTCKTAKKVLRAYLRSDAPCGGSACAREHSVWMCLRAKPGDWPEIAGCTKGRSSRSRRRTSTTQAAMPAAALTAMAPSGHDVAVTEVRPPCPRVSHDAPGRVKADDFPQWPGGVYQRDEPAVEPGTKVSVGRVRSVSRATTGRKCPHLDIGERLGRVPVDIFIDQLLGTAS